MGKESVSGVRNQMYLLFYLLGWLVSLVGILYMGNVVSSSPQ